MSEKVLVTESHLEDIADAIRAKNGDTGATYTPAEMAPAIRAISGADIEGVVAVSYDSLLFPVPKGTHCIYNGKYYISNQAIQAAESFDATHWDLAVVGSEISALQQAEVVTGVKGDGESAYRTGNVNITKANVGLGNVDNTSDLNKPISTAAQTALNAKQDTLTFDTAPTSGSGNPVTSNGIHTALQAKQDTLTFDSTPTSGSGNPVTSGGIFTALQAKQDTLTFDTAPTSGSGNPVTSGGLKTAFDDMADDILGSDFSAANNAGFHNSIYRGKNLGTSVTAEQWAQISAGTFEDLFIGDYWVIGGVNWRIAAFDYWLNTGNAFCTTHHVVIVPDGNLLNGSGSTTHWMNATNITTGAYVGSDFYTGNNSNTGKAQCISKVESAFGSAHILSHREYFANAVTNGCESAVAWYDSTVDMMNEQMVYGCKVFGNVMNGTNVPANQTVDKSQLPLFRLEPSRISNRAYWWLRDVISSANFAFVGYNGFTGYAEASNAWVGVRPAFGIKG